MISMKENLFSEEKDFYRSLFYFFIIISLQNIVAYSVNMTDNLMLGSYSQNALSGAAIVNQITFIVQQTAVAIGESLVVLASQYWGQKRIEPIRTLTGTALKLAFIFGTIVLLIMSIFPKRIVGIFTFNNDIIIQACDYLVYIRFTFLIFIITNTLISSLRSIGVVTISFLISVFSLVINAGVNYILIFGKFGFPEMGIKGAAIGTLVARLVELLIVIIYIVFIDKRLQLLKSNFLRADKELTKDFRKISVPVILSQLLWSISVPLQTAILGNISDDAIAANSIATTFYSYIKVIVQSMAASSSVVIGRTIGKGNMDEVKSQTKTMQISFVILGIVLGILLFFTKDFLLSFYSLTPNAMDMANNMLVLMSVIMVGMSYQMPASGVIRGGGDAKFVMIMNLISVWLIVMPLAFMSAFWWKLPVITVVAFIQSDQVFKCLPSSIRINNYKWVKKLTRDRKKEE